MALVFVRLFLDIDEMDFLNYSVKLSQMRAYFMDDALMSVYVFEATYHTLPTLPDIARSM